MDAAKALAEDQKHAQFIFLYIAFNTLFGRRQYEGSREQAAQDREDFLKRVKRLNDFDHRLGQRSLLRALEACRKECGKLIVNYFLRDSYWRKEKTAKEMREEFNQMRRRAEDQLTGSKVEQWGSGLNTVSLINFLSYSPIALVEDDMARTKACLSSGARLTDYLSASLLARVYPASLIGKLLDAHHCNSRRERSFPATAVAYYCMALSLYPEAAYADVFDAVAQGLAWRNRGMVPPRITASSISVARSRLSWPVFKRLQEVACLPLAGARTCPQAFYCGLRLMAIDGSNIEVPDEADNVKVFGYPGSRTGVAGYPQAQCAVLVECATHAIIAANMGAYRDAEWNVCHPLLASLNHTMLCLADRGFNGYEHWCRAKATGAQLLWRCASNRQLPVQRMLSDGSFLSVLQPSRGPRRKDKRAAVTVRVVEYMLPDAEGTQGRYRLLTTLLDEQHAPALELAALYHERWAVESVFDELKTHLHQRRRVLRSKTPDLVRQEFYGWVLTHYAVRWLMHTAATEHQVPPRMLSFVANVHLLRRAQPQSGAFSPSASAPA